MSHFVSISLNFSAFFPIICLCFNNYSQIFTCNYLHVDPLGNRSLSKQYFVTNFSTLEQLVA